MVDGVRYDPTVDFLPFTTFDPLSYRITYDNYLCAVCCGMFFPNQNLFSTDLCATQVRKEQANTDKGSLRSIDDEHLEEGTRGS